MTTDEINRTIAVAMGLCWHEWEFNRDRYAQGKPPWRCTKDDSEEWIWDMEEKPDFTDPEGFFSAWNWAKEQEWFTKFVFEIGGGYGHYQLTARWEIPSNMIDPPVFAAVLAKYIKEVLNVKG